MELAYKPIDQYCGGLLYGLQMPVKPSHRFFSFKTVMPRSNAFRHQDYADVPADLWEMVTTDDTNIDEADRVERMQQAGRDLSDAGVRVVYLVHGTLMGTDVSGVLGELGRIWPAWSSNLKTQSKRLVDAMLGTTANYDDSFTEALQEGLNGDLGDRPVIDVRRFFWSSQNHTLGRAEAAIELLVELHKLIADADWQNDDGSEGSGGNRIQLWGHSHAGNVFALMTNLLAGDVKSRALFFRAARSYYRKPGTGRVDVPVWQEARKILADRGNPLANVRLDFVNFGTPVRYGWDSDGYDKLMHFNGHIPTEGLPDHRVPFPPTLEQISGASAGDFVQQFFIAGTNFPPTIFAFRSWTAERRLKKLIQPGHRRRDLWDRLKGGFRVADEGKTLLVDYSSGDAESSKTFAGHAIYTKKRWLVFHLERIVKEFYGGK